MSTIRTRREPPPFRAASVVEVVRRSDRLVRLTVAGPELRDLDIGLPAASVRLLVPDPAERVSTATTADPPAVAIPIWNGNEFLRADGTRPPIRTLTPLRHDRDQGSLDLEVVLHGDGPLSSWVDGGPLGHPTAISGTGRGYSIDPEADSFVLAGDESAIPAISVLLSALAGQLPDTPVTVIVEAVEPMATVEMPAHPRATTSWVGRAGSDPPGDTMGAAIAALDLSPGARLWVAGEAAGVHRIRQHLFDQRSMPRAHAVVRGYWKVGRGGDDDD